jgi:NAD(P)-dependent dehydrogenase (short-subunit alcohol dehydrogenase family)
MSTRLNTALITGSSSGIGLDIARAFLDKGLNVVLNGRDEDKLSTVAERLGAPARVAVVAGNIGERETGEAMVRVALERFGSVDVLVNNAGTFGVEPFLDVTEDDLDGFLSGNLKGTCLTTQAVVRQMKNEGGGSIVNIGTVLIHHAMAGLPASAALVSKGGIHALTTSLAAELAADKIRVNAVAPGVIRTPLYGDADVDSFGGVALLDRVGEVDETTDAVLYLATANFTTGHILPVDGGYVTGRS